ncbi:MAG: hypothetical protein OET81_11245, partial [Desulfobacteraceae bacterium]|nr:hypothetical protein [Desulfobacteraceae bacterium]
MDKKVGSLRLASVILNNTVTASKGQEQRNKPLLLSFHCSFPQPNGESLVSRSGGQLASYRKLRIFSDKLPGIPIYHRQF